MGHRLEDLDIALRPGSLASDAVIRRAMSNALATAEGLGCETIGLPPLAGSVPGFPTDVGASLMLEALWEYVEGNPTTRIRAVIVMLADPNQAAIFEAARASLATREEEAHDQQRQAAVHRGRAHGTR